MFDLGILNPQRRPLSTDNPLEQCRVYDRLPVQSAVRTAMYAVLLSPGNRLGTAEVTKLQLNSLLQDLITHRQSDWLRGHYERLMLKAPLGPEWLQHIRFYDAAEFVLLLPSPVKLKPEDETALLELAKQGMRFAIYMNDLDAVAAKPEVLRCFHFFLIKIAEKDQQLPRFVKIRQRLPQAKSIGVGDLSGNVDYQTAGDYDLVLGRVTSPLLTYTGERPEWQRVLIRTFAELYSDFYDLGDLLDMAPEYPIMGRAIKAMLTSADVTTACIECQPGGGRGRQKINREELRDLLCIGTGFALYCQSYKLSWEIFFNREMEHLTLDQINLAPFALALFQGKLVNLFAEKNCDEFGRQQAFLTGFLSHAHLFLLDEYAKLRQEFALEAVVGRFDNEGNDLGRVVGFVRALQRRDTARINAILAQSDFNYDKEEVFKRIEVAGRWADVILNTLIASSQME